MASSGRHDPPTSQGPTRPTRALPPNPIQAPSTPNQPRRGPNRAPGLGLPTSPYDRHLPALVFGLLIATNQTMFHLAATLLALYLISQATLIGLIWLGVLTEALINAMKGIKP